MQSSRTGLIACIALSCGYASSGSALQTTSLLGTEAGNPNRRLFRITAIDSGQGDCTLVECPDGANIMVDCGSSRWANSSPDHARAQLQTHIGSAPIDTLVLTHPDRDHYNWIPRVLEGRSIERLVYAGALQDYDQQNTSAWLAARVPHMAPALHGHLLRCGGLRVEVIAANVEPTGRHATSASWQSNTRSIVLIVHESYREIDRGARALAILTGDATWYTERFILQLYSGRPALLHADLLRLAHHGSDVTSSEQGWLDAVRPKAVFSSAGHYGGNLRHPRCATVDRVMRTGYLMETTCHQLSCGTVASAPMDPGPWRSIATTAAVYNTHESGDLTFTFQSGTLVDVSEARGGCGG